MDKKDSAPKAVQKELIIRALTDPAFRKQLTAEPVKTLGLTRATPEVDRELAVVLAAIKGIEAQIDHIADVLFCALKISPPRA